METTLENKKKQSKVGFCVSILLPWACHCKTLAREVTQIHHIWIRCLSAKFVFLWAEKRRHQFVLIDDKLVMNKWEFHYSLQWRRLEQQNPITFLGFLGLKPHPPNFCESCIPPPRPLSGIIGKHAHVRAPMSLKRVSECWRLTQGKDRPWSRLLILRWRWVALIIKVFVGACSVIFF